MKFNKKIWVKSWRINRLKDELDWLIIRNTIDYAIHYKNPKQVISMSKLLRQSKVETLLDQLCPHQCLKWR